MKQVRLIAIFSSLLVIVSCAKTADIDSLQQQIDALKSDQIASIQSQISNIQTSIKDLEKMDSALDAYIKTLQDRVKELDAQDDKLASDIAAAKTELQNAISALQTKDTEIEGKIAKLQSYVDDELSKNTDWVKATFATLEQYNTLCDEVAGIKTSIGTISSDLAQTNADLKEAKETLEASISSLETTMKSWVNEQLAGYYTIAQMDAKIAELEKCVSDGDKTNKDEIDALKTSLETAKTEIKDAYEKAISDAIAENNGTIDAKISNALKDVNDKIKNLEDRVSDIESRLADVENTIKKILAKIQSISYVPVTDDGYIEMKKSIGNDYGFAEFDYLVSPASVLADMENCWSDLLVGKGVYTQTKSTVEFVDLPVVGFECDKTSGAIHVTYSGINIDEDFFNSGNAMNVALFARDAVNNISSEFVCMRATAAAAGNVITYKTSNNQILNISEYADFGAEIESHTYESGLGVIRFVTPVTKISYKEGAIVDYILNGEYLTEINLPGSIIEIESWKCQEWGGYNTPFDLTVNFGEGFTIIPEGFLMQGCTVTTLNLPESVTKIGQDAFSRCEYLTTINFGSNLKEIGLCAFSQCHHLEHVDFPSSLTTIREGAFADCALETVSIPDNVSLIEEGAFVVNPIKTFLGKFATADNKALICNNTLVAFIKNGYVSYEIPEGVNKIGKYAFYGVPLQNVTFPSSLKTINEEAFSHTQMTDIVITEGVEYIGRCAFNCIEQAKSITLPSTLTYLGDAALNNCYNLETLWCYAVAAPSGTYGGDQFPSTFIYATNPHIYVPAESVDAYKTLWTDQADIISAIPYVDLGLSVKWATCNLGASSPEQYGLYYQWGDTQGYGSDTSDGKYFDWADNSGNVTYKWCNGSPWSLKYNTSSSYGIVDNKTLLDPEDDAAYVALGGNWRMPTDAEWTELRNNCTWNWTSDYNGTGVAGSVVTSNKEGYADKSIFLPAAGYRYHVSIDHAGSYGDYLSSSLYTGIPYDAYGVCFYSGGVERTGYRRCDGHSVRPVQE